MFGLFMLFGIVKKNGILQVDYTNELRARGMPRDEAILEANHDAAAADPDDDGDARRGDGPDRARPGARRRRRAPSMAKVIIGGQMLSLLLTLLVTPVAYSLFDDLARRRVGAAPPHAPARPRRARRDQQAEARRDPRSPELISLCGNRREGEE